jgi:hypothetical protein
VLETPSAEILLAPLFAVLVAGGLVLLSRWAFGSSGVRHVVARPDYGLLVPVVRLPDREAAEVVRARLAERGIRSTVVDAGKGYDAEGRPWAPGSTHVLVFPDDAERARAVVGVR